MSTTISGDGKDWNVSRDVARALTGKLGKSYLVVLHGLERHRFHVEAETADAAHNLAMHCVRKDRPTFKDTGATIQLENN